MSNYTATPRRMYYFHLVPEVSRRLFCFVLSEGWSLEEVGDLLFCLAGHRHVLSGPGSGGRVAPFMAPVWQSCLYMKVTLFLFPDLPPLPALPGRYCGRHGLLSTLRMTIASRTGTIYPYFFMPLCMCVHIWVKVSCVLSLHLYSAGDILIRPVCLVK